MRRARERRERFTYVDLDREKQPGVSKYAQIRRTCLCTEKTAYVVCTGQCVSLQVLNVRPSSSSSSCIADLLRLYQRFFFIPRISHPSSDPRLRTNNNPLFDLVFSKQANVPPPPHPPNSLGLNQCQYNTPPSFHSPLLARSLSSPYPACSFIVRGTTTTRSRREKVVSWGRLTILPVFVAVVAVV